MQLFLGVIVFLLIVMAMLILVGLHYIRKGVLKVRKIMTGDLDDEETFRRMADKHYRGKDDPEFDKDYFKRSQSSKKTDSQQPRQKQRTTTTTEGVTIIDDRTNDERRKIFEDNEGEYVDYQEVK